jgi:hypothetical protein
LLDVVAHDLTQARRERADRRVGAHPGGVEEEFLPPDQAGRVAEFDNPLEETLEDLAPQSIPDPREAGVVGQRLIQVIPQVPAVRQVQTGNFDELALRAESLEEHDQLELEKDHRIDGGAAVGGVAVFDPGAHETEVELGVEVAVEVADGYELLQRGQDGTIKIAGFLGTEHNGNALLVEGPARQSLLHRPRRMTSNGYCRVYPRASRHYLVEQFTVYADTTRRMGWMVAGMRNALSLAGALTLDWLLTIAMAMVTARAVRRGVRVALLQLPGQAPATTALPRWLSGYVVLSGVIATATLVAPLIWTNAMPIDESANLFWPTLAGFIFISVLWPVLLFGLMLFYLVGEGPRPWR